MVSFLLACVVALFLPGDVFVKRLGLPIFQRVVLATGLGFALWALQGFVFGFLGLRDLTYAYLVVAAVLWLKR
jgi:hypothetical protein